MESPENDPLLFDNTRVSDVLRSLTSNYESKKELISTTIETVTDMMTDVPTAIVMLSKIRELLESDQKNAQVIVNMLTVIIKKEPASKRNAPPALPEGENWEAELAAALAQAKPAS